VAQVLRTRGPNTLNRERRIVVTGCCTRRWVAGAATSLSSLSVVGNALRLCKAAL
jgi:hypothetical protein